FVSHVIHSHFSHLSYCFIIIQKNFNPIMMLIPPTNQKNLFSVFYSRHLKNMHPTLIMFYTVPKKQTSLMNDSLKIYCIVRKQLQPWKKKMALNSSSAE